jgi:predicted nicotinamide N-methyase
VRPAEGMPELSDVVDVAAAEPGAATVTGETAAALVASSAHRNTAARELSIDLVHRVA